MSKKELEKNGYVVKANSLGFVAGVSAASLDKLALGGFCMTGRHKQPGARAETLPAAVYGLISGVEVLGDELAQRLATADLPIPAAVIADQRLNKITVMVKAIIIGYRDGKDRVFGNLPPVPPLIYDPFFPAADPLGADGLGGRLAKTYMQHVFGHGQDSGGVGLPELLVAHVRWLHKHLAQTDKGASCQAALEAIGNHYKHNPDMIYYVSSGLADLI